MALVNVYFSLGSNLGDREGNISEALDRMDAAFGRHYESLSELIETEPMGFSGGKFLNCAVLYRIPALRLLRPFDKLTTAQAQQPNGPAPEPVEGALHVLDTVKAIEREMGRTDPPEYDGEGNKVYHSRVIDIDILFYGRERLDSPRLTIPHKGIADRPFVMIPLREIARPSLKKAFPEYFKKKQ